MRELVKSLAKEATVLISSHNLKEISETCDRILVMNDGEIIAKGTTDELMTLFTEESQSLNATLVGATNTISACLSSIEGVANHSIVSTKDEVSECIIEWKSKETEKLTQALVESKIGVRSIASGSDSLENIFLSLTQGGES